MFAQHYTRPLGKIYTYTLTSRDTPDYKKRLEKRSDPNIIGIWSDEVFDSTKLVNGFVSVLFKRNDSVILKHYYFNKFIIDLGYEYYWYIEKDGKHNAYSDLILNDAQRFTIGRCLHRPSIDFGR
jgi:hypothetical protein